MSKDIGTWNQPARYLPPTPPEAPPKPEAAEDFTDSVCRRINELERWILQLEGNTNIRELDQMEWRNWVEAELKSIRAEMSKDSC